MKIAISFTILLIAGLVFVLIGANLRLPVDVNDTVTSVFVVTEGEGIKSIAKRLESDGLVRNRFVFLFEVRRLGLAQKIQAGDFRLSKSMNTSQVAEALTIGTLDIWVRLLEGWRAEEIAEKLKEAIPTYENSWVLELRKHEGRLFPDTYLIPKDADSNLVVRILTGNFEKKLKEVEGDVGKNGLSLEESIVLASIIEREALFDEDRPLIAGVLINRLAIGMALQADATVQYALGYQVSEKDWWKKHLTKDDLAMNSPYNTYKFPGLPPKPISNPGLASLRAALNPADTDYLYYLHDKTGRTHYAKTLEEHNANVAKYLTP